MACASVDLWNVVSDCRAGHVKNARAVREVTRCLFGNGTTGHLKREHPGRADVGTCTDSTTTAAGLGVTAARQRLCIQRVAFLGSHLIAYRCLDKFVTTQALTGLKAQE
jgi:hypothetical protein